MNVLKKLCLLLVVVLCLTTNQAFAENPPNVIFVLADDLGIGDISPTSPDCKIKTPHLQKMAHTLLVRFAHRRVTVC